MVESADNRKLRLRARDLTWRSVEGQIVVLDLRRSVFSELNATGSLLWEQMAETAASVDELAQHLASRFDIDPSRARADVERFVKSLAEADLLEE